MVKKMPSLDGQAIGQSGSNEYVPNGHPEYQLNNLYPSAYNPYGMAPQLPSTSDVANCNMLISEGMANQQHWFHPQPQQPAYNYVATSNTREMRNKAEKQRRDRLNAFINELAKLIPMVARSQKRLDKTSILRLAATHLRIYQTLVKQKGTPQMELPPHVDQFLLDQLICDEMGSFMLILSPVGKIIFVSHTVETLLGHLQTDLMGQSLFTVTAVEDHDKLRLHLTGDGEMMSDWKKYFTVSIKRAGPKSETPQYESVRMMGVHKNLVNNNEGQVSCSSSTSSLPATMNSEILIFLVKITRPQPLVDRLVVATRDEYRTRHLIDGRIVSCDQRISLIAGYMIDEIQGHSAFQYMHREEVRFVMIALRQMYDKGESKGNSCYRLKSRDGNFIYLKTFGFLEIDENGIVESFLCVNVLVDEREGKELIKEMKRRFSALFTSSLSNLRISEHAVPMQNVPALTAISPSKADRTEDPQALEVAINELMQNLPSPGTDEFEAPCSESSSHFSPIGKVPAIRVSKRAECPPTKPPHLRIAKSNCKRSSTSSPDHVKRQRLNSVESQPSQLSPCEMTLNGLLDGTDNLQMQNLVEQYSPSDLLMFRQHANHRPT